MRERDGEGERAREGGRFNEKELSYNFSLYCSV
jgi:hypothetical protein